MNTPHAKRVERIASFDLKADPERVFPLLCPVREYDWIAEWSCELVYAASGRIEPGCVFTTQPPGLPEKEVWVVAAHDRLRRRVAFIRFLPGHCVTRMDIFLENSGESGTRITCAKVFTSLGPAGDALLERFTPEDHEAWLRGLGVKLDHYLATGTMLRPGGTPPPR